jgi:hypothetical protein
MGQPYSRGGGAKASHAKSSSKGTSTAKRVMNVPITKNENVSVRAIQNGFIISKSGYVGKGKNQQYVNKEYHSPTNPLKFGGKK